MINILRSKGYFLYFLIGFSQLFFFTGEAIGSVKSEFTETQLNRWIKLAESDDKMAQFTLAVIYRNGNGVDVDEGKVIYWLRKAAANNLSMAQHNLALYYLTGYGVGKDYDLAMNWYRKAANQGYLPSIFSIGYLYEVGLGVKQDFITAARYYEKAALGGFAEAQLNLGSLYAGGKGVEQDFNAALYWFKKAAKKDPVAQLNIGNLYFNGQGVCKDLEKAEEWYLKAAYNGNATAQFNLGIMSAKRKSTKNLINGYAWLKASEHSGYPEVARNLKILDELLDVTSKNEANELAKVFIEKYVLPFKNKIQKLSLVERVEVRNPHEEASKIEEE